MTVILKTENFALNLYATVHRTKIFTQYYETFVSLLANLI